MTFEVYTPEQRAARLEFNLDYIITNTIKYEGIFEDDFETYVINDYNRMAGTPVPKIKAAMESWKKKNPEKVIAARKRERPTH